MNPVAFIERELAARPHRELISALIGPPKYNSEHGAGSRCLRQVVCGTCGTPARRWKTIYLEQQFVADVLENKGMGRRPKESLDQTSVRI